MNHLIFFLIGLVALLFTSCQENNGQIDQVAGTWKLTSFENDGGKVELSECDIQTTWNFTKDIGDPLSDGTEVKKLNATAPENCEYYGFNSKWTVKDGQLFISSSRIGGMGGYSLAGMMKIKELSNDTMVVQFMKKVLTFSR